MQGGQRGLMLALPLLFVGVVARFPAGLAVYWITTSLWTLGQQLVFWRLAPARRARCRSAPTPAPEPPRATTAQLAQAQEARPPALSRHNGGMGLLSKLLGRDRQPTARRPPTPTRP